MSRPLIHTEVISLRLTPELADWLDRIIASSGRKFEGRAVLVRSMLEALMKDDQMQHGERAA